MTWCINHLDSGGIFLNVDSIHEDDGRYRVNLVIRDSGEGIPDYKLLTMFQPAYVKRGPGAPYLCKPSLYIAKTLTELLGGEFVVESTLGWGTRYAVSLKLKPAFQHYYYQRPWAHEVSQNWQCN